MSEVVHPLSDMEIAVAEVRVSDADSRYEVISRHLRGAIDYSVSYGKALGTRRAIFCSRLSGEQLWPERK
jgi:hypothetical protein